MPTVGIDLVDIGRVRQARYFERVSEYILRPSEIALMRTSRDRFQYLASRLAAKEAVVKAFPATIGLQDIEVLGFGVKPSVRVLHVEALNYTIDISLTHTNDLAIGAAIVCHA